MLQIETIMKRYSKTIKTVNLLIPVLLFVMSVNAQTINTFGVQTKIEKGTVEGNYDTKSGLQMYFGIPFAKPPVGELRWKAPQPLDPWRLCLEIWALVQMD